MLEDRIKFKLYAAEQHLKKLKEIDKKHDIILKDRVNAEMEIDCFFAELIGAKDSLLIYINEKLNLGLTLKDVTLDKVNSKLKAMQKQDIVEELNKLACNKNSWFGY